MVLAGKNNSPISIGRPTPAYTCRNLFPLINQSTRYA
jgi:hypothetical protein